MLNYLHIHYDEISLKGKNKRHFENLLRQNILDVLGKYNLSADRLRIEWGFLSLQIDKERSYLPELLQDLKYIPGIHHIELVYRQKLKDNEIDPQIVKDFVKDILAKNVNYKTFRITTKRLDKSYPIKSMEMNRQMGGLLLENFSQLSVDLENYDFELKIIIRQGQYILTAQRVEAVGGLPVGTAGKVVSLLSGGIDSPVASALMLKRGAEVVLVHFKNKSINTTGVQDKIEQLAESLSKFKHNLKLYIVDFQNLQKEIIKEIPGDYRMIIYKRLMLKISQAIAHKIKGKALVTGDSLSQVASQTLDNISAIYEAVDLPIFSPLIGLNKQEIIDISKDIGTYDISILPYGDCCSLLLSQHPQTHAKIKDVKQLEEQLNIKDLVAKGLENLEIKNYPKK